MENRANDKVLEFLLKRHETIQFNYNPPFGKGPEDCTRIALHIARLLLEQGKVSRIVRFSKDDGELIRPAIFKRKLGWGYHDACLYNGNIYDPVLEEPTPLEDYCTQVFGERMPLKVIVDEANIEARVMHSIRLE